MVTNTDVRIAGGCFTILLGGAVLGIPFWLVSLGWWGWFLAVPAGILIYGVAISLMVESIQKSRYRKARKADAAKAEREAREAYFRNR